jgi:hypothetical protein
VAAAAVGKKMPSKAAHHFFWQEQRPQVNLSGNVPKVHNKDGKLVIDTTATNAYMTDLYNKLPAAQKARYEAMSRAYAQGVGAAAPAVSAAEAAAKAAVIAAAADAVVASLIAGTDEPPAKKARPGAELGATPTADSVAGVGGMTAFLGQVAENMSGMLNTVGISMPVMSSKADGKAPAPEPPSDMSTIVDAINARIDTDIESFKRVVSVYGQALTSDTTKLPDVIVSNFMRDMMSVPAGTGWPIHFEYNGQRKLLVLSDSDRAFLATEKAALLLTAKDKVEAAFKDPEPLPEATVRAFHKALMGAKFRTSP